MKTPRHTVIVRVILTRSDGANVQLGAGNVDIVENKDLSVDLIVKDAIATHADGNEIPSGKVVNWEHFVRYVR